MPIKNYPSPNFDQRTVSTPSILVFHYTDMKTAEEALERLTDPESKVSAHYLIDEQGQVYQLVQEDKRAWHAGISAWRGMGNINDCSIGIELANPGHQFGYRPFPQKQIDTLVELSHKLINKYKIIAENIVGHSDIAPLRKKDPGELFPWQYLASQDIGHYPLAETVANTASPLLNQDDIFYILQNIGYPVSYGYHDKQDQFSIFISAFQRRFAQNEPLGTYTNATEQALLAVYSLYKKAPSSEEN